MALKMGAQAYFRMKSLNSRAFTSGRSEKSLSKQVARVVESSTLGNPAVM